MGILGNKYLAHQTGSFVLNEGILRMKTAQVPSFGTEGLQHTVATGYEMAGAVKRSKRLALSPLCHKQIQ